MALGGDAVTGGSTGRTYDTGREESIKHSLCRKISFYSFPETQWSRLIHTPAPWFGSNLFIFILFWTKNWIHHWFNKCNKVSCWDERWLLFQKVVISSEKCRNLAVQQGTATGHALRNEVHFISRPTRRPFLLFIVKVAAPYMPLSFLVQWVQWQASFRERLYQAPWRIITL